MWAPEKIKLGTGKWLFRCANGRLSTRNRSLAKFSKRHNLKHTLTKIESDVVVKPSVQTVVKIIKALGVSIEDLIK
jgi:hypothetical protein